MMPRMQSLPPLPDGYATRAPTPEDAPLVVD